VKFFLATENIEDTENSFWILEFGFWIYFLRGEKSSWRSWRLGGWFGVLTMAEKEQVEKEGGAATATAATGKKTTPKKQPPKLLPPWKVLLHNDDKNSFEFVILTVVALTPLDGKQAVLRTVEAHETGVSLLLVTHKERAELYKDQFASKGLTVTIEPDEK
jgi:ATP-dependent Clp protease adaptor protein ClpS